MQSQKGYLGPDSECSQSQNGYLGPESECSHRMVTWDQTLNAVTEWLPGTRL
ncbi:hypothetical protein DPMN_090601 [Dreissena polymorpha]|uniref:Uncharacterized protein n=1 Tax=Dreissena polymorpha TaxID=45954 RepID=A0A9D4KY10_DREPO|nr:hypothetical protein DPMN_090601 [Dreissena polymorpha]